jgi:hypothetical protein
MNWPKGVAGEDPELELELEQALKHFKASMDAWSDAAFNRPRTAPKLAVRHSWRLATGWALGALLVMGSLAGAAHQIYQRQELARVAAQKAAQKAAEQRAAAGRAVAMLASAQVERSAPPAAIVKVNAGTKDEDLLASVDSDVSRVVPAAMEPLAQLMDDDEPQ